MYQNNINSFYSNGNHITEWDNCYEQPQYTQEQIMMAQQLSSMAVANNMLGNNFDQMNFHRELQKYNNRLLAKMNKLERIPRVTKKMVEEALWHTICVNCQEVPFHTLTFLRFEETPEYMTKHCCYHTGVTVNPTYTTSVYTTQVMFDFCPYCCKVRYYYEVAEEEYYSPFG